jgi:hypothetical protein
MSGGCDTSKSSLIKNIPLWAFHGALDPTVPPAGTRAMMKSLKNKGIDVLSYTAQYASYFANATIQRSALKDSIVAGRKTLYTEYTDGGHDIWTKSYNDPLLAQWLFMQKKQSGTHAAPIRDNPRTKRMVPALFPLFDEYSIAAFFTGLEPRTNYEVDVVDSKGKLIGRTVIEGSKVSTVAIKGMLGNRAGMAWMKLTPMAR